MDTLGIKKGEKELLDTLHKIVDNKNYLNYNKEKDVERMFQQNQKPFHYIPQATVKIPLNQQLAALVVHMFQHRCAGVTISLDDIQAMGAQLVLSTLIDNTSEEKGYKDVLTVVENEDLNSLQELINSMIEQKFNENDEELLEYFNQLNDEDDEDDWEDEEELAF
ncbi:MAG: hypothetical protein N4A64_08920 [Marinisporobacter sp.]|jgi:hypothetical protein|nr:hypothetical protein [Marinisporobacter sp.]